MQPRFLKSGVAWSIELDALSRSYIQGGKKPRYWDILRQETEQMYNLDIPFFKVPTSSTEFPTGVHDYLSVATWPDLIERVQQMSETDLAFQTHFIYGSFSTRYDFSPFDATPYTGEPPHVTDQQLIDKAIELANDLQDAAIYNE